MISLVTKNEGVKMLNHQENGSGQILQTLQEKLFVEILEPVQTYFNFILQINLHIY